MTIKDIKELIKLVNTSDLAEVKIELEQAKLTIRSKDFFAGKNQVSAPSVISMPQVAAAPAAPVAAAPATAPQVNTALAKPASSEQAEDTSGYLEIKSPMVGTFYRSASPDKPPYFKVGDSVAEGDVVCIVEAMKLFNEIESEVSGTIVKVLIEDAHPVEYDQPLFLVDPNG